MRLAGRSEMTKRRMISMDYMKMSIIGSGEVERTRKGRGGKRRNRRPFTVSGDNDALGRPFKRG